VAEGHAGNTGAVRATCEVAINSRCAALVGSYPIRYSMACSEETWTHSPPARAWWG